MNGAKKHQITRSQKINTSDNFLIFANFLQRHQLQKKRYGESPQSFWASLFPFNAGYASRFGQFQWRHSCSAPGFLPSTFFRVCMPHAPFAPLDGDKQTVATGWQVPGIAIWLSMSVGMCACDMCLSTNHKKTGILQPLDSTSAGIAEGTVAAFSAPRYIGLRF